MNTRSYPMRLGVARADGDVVEEAEAHGLVRFGVVPRRPHRAEHAPHAVVPALLDRRHDRAGGIGCGLEASGRGVRVRVHLAGAHVPDPLDDLGRMDEREVFAGGLAAD